MAVFPNRECQLLILPFSCGICIQLIASSPGFSLVISPSRDPQSENTSAQLCRAIQFSNGFTENHARLQQLDLRADSGDELGIISLRPLRMALPVFAQPGPEYLPDKLVYLTAVSDSDQRE